MCKNMKNMINNMKTFTLNYLKFTLNFIKDTLNDRVIYISYFLLFNWRKCY